MKACRLIPLLLGCACGGQGVVGGTVPSSMADDVSAAEGAPLQAAQFEAAAMSDGAPADLADATGGAWRVIEVPAASSLPAIVRTPSGWLALSNRLLGEGKAFAGAQSALYRSADGIHWQRAPLEDGHDNLQLRGLAYGNGRHVMMGQRFGEGGGGVFWTSSDGETWREGRQQLDDGYEWRNVVFAGAHFFALGNRYLGVSTTGDAWEIVDINNAQPEAVAYGNGRYVLVGSGPIQVSTDGKRWTDHSVDCALPGACITDPSGGIHQGYRTKAIFAEGRFFTDELSSADGMTWEPLPDRSPSGYVSGHFLGSFAVSAGMPFWTSKGPVQTLRVIRPIEAAVTAAGRDLRSVGVLDRDAPFPDSVNAEFEDGLTCLTASCIVLDNWLLLVPPPGTARLEDRVPRRADGTPLLTDECPVSGGLFCDDYTARSGCTCNPEAPREPASCSDVSQYRCAGRFTPQGNEWQVAEVAQAGCSCDGVDPYQPSGFGVDCTGLGNPCLAPFQCLGIETPSFGFPEPQRFMCTSACSSDADCPSWQATGFCAGPVQLRCASGSCQPRSCE